MKLLVVSDVESKFIWDHFDPDAFRGVDLMISCGDLSARYLSFLVTMIPRPLVYVPGNHDTRYLKEPPEGCVPLDDRLLVYKGIRILGFGGCKSQRNAEFEYTDQQMWRRVRRMEGAIRRAGGVDILVTHAPALGLGDGPDKFHEGFEAFRYLDETYRPKLHFYGHKHINTNPVDKKALLQFEDTLLINACGYKLVEYDAEMRERPPVLPPRSFRLPFTGK